MSWKDIIIEKKNVDEVKEITKFSSSMAEVLSALSMLIHSESEDIAKESKKLMDMAKKLWNSSDKPLRAYGRDNYKKDDKK